MPQLSPEVTFEESDWLGNCYFTPNINMKDPSESSFTPNEDNHIPPIKFRKTMGRYQLVKPDIEDMASSPEVVQDMNMASPEMPVLEPEISRPNTRRWQQLTSTLTPKGTLIIGTQRKDQDIAITPTSSAPCSDVNDVTPPPKVPQADLEKENSSKMLPVGAQISLRAYYYGRWNYQEEEAIKRKPTKLAGKISRKRKSIFDTEFTKYNASSILKTLVDVSNLLY
jgi:hypothetical protein